MDRLDAPGGAPDPADVEWLVRTASLGPEVISEAVTAELVELAQNRQVPWATREAAQAVLVPLTAAGRVPETTAAQIALASLAEGAGTQASKLLVTAAKATRAESITSQVARSAVELAGHTGDPVARAMSRFSGNAVAADPAPLLLCAERNPEVVLRAVEQMLASASRAPTTALVGPDGQPLGPTGETTDFPGAVDRPGSVAAVACLPLIEEMPGTAPRLVEALARTLESPDHDRYDAPPSKMVAMTLGQALLRRYADVAPPFLAVAHRISAEGRKSLFEAVSSALHSMPSRVHLTAIARPALDKIIVINDDSLQD